MNTEEPKTPELDKMLKVHETSNAIGQFLEWFFNTKGLTPGRWPRPDECTSCGHDRSVHNQRHVNVRERYEVLIDDLDLTPEQKVQVRDKLVQAEHPDSTEVWVGAGCNECGTSNCNQYDHDEEHLIPEPQRIESLLCDYFDVDEKKAEAERVSLLEYVRSRNKNK